MTHPYFTITHAHGDLEIHVIDGRVAQIEDRSDVAIEQLADATYRITGVEGRLKLGLPADATLSVTDHRGPITINGIAQVTIETAFGDISIADIVERVSLRDLTGNLDVRDCAALVLQDGPRPQRHDEDRGVKNVTVRNVNDVALANIRRDLVLVGSQQATIENIGGACTVRDITNNLQVANVGGECAIEQIGGTLSIQHIGGSARFTNISVIARLGNIGGDLHMTAAPLHISTNTSSLHLAIGGTVLMELPATADVTIQVIVGGTLSAPGHGRSGPGMHRVTYGAGTAHLHLVVGGDVVINGGGEPQVTNPLWSTWAKVGAELSQAVAAVVKDVRSR